MGPFKPPSSHGNKYIMVVTDYFSKYVEVRALPDQTAITTADAFLEMIVRRHGTPKAIVSDRGVNFTSKIFQRLCKSLGIKQKLATSHHPATNGETERFNRTLTMLLRKELINSHTETGKICWVTFVSHIIRPFTHQLKILLSFYYTVAIPTFRSIIY
jgi:transposase InsO family protein